MAAISLKDAYVAINSSDLSDYVKSVTLSYSVDELDTTTMGDNGKERIAGLEDNSLSIGFVADFASSALDSILWPIRGTVVTFEVRPTSSAVSTTNPKYTGSVLINELVPIDGSVGELAEFSVTWPVSGVVTRATA